MTTAMATPPDSGPSVRVLFDAVLQPHRSLSPDGFRILMGCVVLAGMGIGTVFLVAGAWPVFGFCGLEILLFYVLFRLNYRDGRRREYVTLTDQALTVRRTRPDGRSQTWRFQPFWLQVAIDEPPEHHSQITLSSHGRSLVIGSFLTPQERLGLAAAIRQALTDCRTRTTA